MRSIVVTRIRALAQRRAYRLSTVPLLATVCLAAPARADMMMSGGDKPQPVIHYRQINLVADLPGVARLQDTNLVNAWGMTFSSTSPFWINDNGTGLATIYSVTNDASGQTVVTKQSLEVNIPGEGTPSGIVFNGTGAFHNDVFIFASEDGTISGWRNSLGTNAEVLVSRSNAVYKAITLTHTAHGPVLLAANFAEARVDVYDTNLTLKAQYADPHAPAGYAPFNIAAVADGVVVTYAKQDDKKHDDVAGRGHGLIDLLDPDTGQFQRFATGSAAGGKLPAINSPWGVAVAPASFGRFAGDLLIGNFGSGTIMVFDAGTGRFRGLLKGVHEGTVKIDGLWALAFGNGARAGDADTLFFTAGPDKENHGLFGALVPRDERRHN